MNWQTWIDNNAITTDTTWINGIQYKFATLDDGWIAIFEIGRDGKPHPQIQAADMAHAESWCYMRDPINVPFDVICER